MILRGAYQKIGLLWFPPDVRAVNPDHNGPLAERLGYLEQEAEKAVLRGEVVVINCKYLGVRSEETDIAIRAGTVPLRWGSPRLLLVTPEHSRALMQGDEIARAWRLWRYKFDPGCDAWVDGSPAKAEALIRRNINAGRPWTDGFATS